MGDCRSRSWTLEMNSNRDSDWIRDSNKGEGDKFVVPFSALIPCGDRTILPVATPIVAERLTYS